MTVKSSPWAYFCWICQQAQQQVANPFVSQTTARFIAFACRICQQQLYTWKVGKTTFFAPFLHVVLFEPEIVGNVGAIIRLAANFGFRLHLIQPFGFIYSAKWLNRSSTSHFERVKPILYNNWAEFITKTAPANLLLTSSAGEIPFSEVVFPVLAPPLYIVFGKEATGLPATLLKSKIAPTVHLETTTANSLNLANSVAIIAYQITQKYRLFRLHPGNILLK